MVTCGENSEQSGGNLVNADVGKFPVGFGKFALFNRLIKLSVKIANASTISHDSRMIQ